MPWLDFTLPNSKEKLGTVNVAYLFKPNMSGFYLTFRVYFYYEIENKYGKYLLIYLKNKSRHIREFLEEFHKLRDDFLFSMDFSEDTGILKKHSAGTIVAKYYDATNVPSDENLINDLNYFLELYGFVIDNYEDKTELTVDEWIEVLESEELIDEKMFSILEIMYNMDNFSATTGQISKKREELGFYDEKSYNSVIISNSKKIKEYLDKKPIYNKDGSENFWTRFFYGKKVDDTFEFKMNDKLVEAFSKINRNKNTDKIVKSLVKINKKEENGDESMDEFSEDNKYSSFYNFLLDKGYLFDKETIENYLLSLKVKPFAILTGNSGTGKTKLSQLFAKYLKDSDSLQDNNKLNSILTEVTVGKSSNSGGWSLNRNDLKDLIPIGEFEKNYPIVVDGVPANADLKLNPRLFYKGNELKLHLEELAEEDEKQKVPLEILLNQERIIKNKDIEEYITFKDKESKLIKNGFRLGNKTVNVLLGTYKYFYKMDISWDGYKFNGDIKLHLSAKSNSEELIQHLNSLKDYSDIEIKIREKDILDTFIKEQTLEKTKLSFEREFGRWNYWVFNDFEWENIINIKRNYSWNAIVDGIKTKFSFRIRRVDFSINLSEEERLKEIFAKKSQKDKIKIVADLSTLKRYDINYNFNLEEDFGFILINDNENILDYSNDFGNEKIKENNSNIEFNSKIIPVGANWTENRNIVGYYNVITDQYTSTPAYELIQDASANKKEPYFLILDEMNLSHVERYFADFLSAMESGEDIPLYGAEDLEIPPNLFIIGTVNVDETTYMFSPKVLDRANVLEFKTHSAKSYMNGNIDVEAPDGDILFLENPLSGSEIRESGIDELRKSFEGVTVDGEDFWTVLSSEIDKFQSVLSKSGFDFGFRVINEIVRFMAVAWKYEGSPKEFNNWTRYFDAQIKQKMLPKLHGSEKIIGDTLNELYEICLNSSIADEDLAKYPESYKKLEEMKFVLRKQRYVSFIN